MRGGSRGHVVVIHALPLIYAVYVGGSSPMRGAWSRSGRERVELHRRRSKGAGDLKTIRGLVNAAIGVLAVVILAGAPVAQADIVTDANAKAADMVSRIPAPPITVRMMAIVQVLGLRGGQHDHRPLSSAAPKLTPAPGRRSKRRLPGDAQGALELIPPSRRSFDADYRPSSVRSLTAPRRPRASRSASRPRLPSWRCAPTTGLSHPTSTAPPPQPGSTCRRWDRRCLTGASAARGS